METGTINFESATITHQTINGRYRIVFEKAASANKVDGFKVEVNADDIGLAESDATRLYEYALASVETHKPAVVAPAIKGEK